MSETDIETLRRERDDALARLALAEAELSMTGARLSPEDVKVDPFWSKVVGHTYEPFDRKFPIKHMHPLHVKPVFESVRGTPAADVIVGLLFLHMITSNNAQYAWKKVAELEDRARADVTGR